MDLEIIILSEVRKRQISYDATYMQNLKQDPNEYISETKTESRTQKTDWRLPREREWGKRWIGRLGLPDVSFMCRMDK